MYPFLVFVRAKYRIEWLCCDNLVKVVSDALRKICHRCWYFMGDFRDGLKCTAQKDKLSERFSDNTDKGIGLFSVPLEEQADVELCRVIHNISTSLTRAASQMLLYMPAEPINIRKWFFIFATTGMCHHEVPKKAGGLKECKSGWGSSEHHFFNLQVSVKWWTQWHFAKTLTTWSH